MITVFEIVALISGDKRWCSKLKIAVCLLEVQQYEINVIQESHWPYKSKYELMTSKQMKIEVGEMCCTQYP